MSSKILLLLGLIVAFVLLISSDQVAAARELAETATNKQTAEVVAKAHGVDDSKANGGPYTYGGPGNGGPYTYGGPGNGGPYTYGGPGNGGPYTYGGPGNGGPYTYGRPGSPRVP